MFARRVYVYLGFVAYYDRLFCRKLVMYCKLLLSSLFRFYSRPVKNVEDHNISISAVVILKRLSKMRSLCCRMWIELYYDKIIKTTFQLGFLLSHVCVYIFS